MMPAGSINSWKCPNCGRLTTAVHVDDGVTPMFLGCRTTPGCKGMAVSAGYPQATIPPHIIASIACDIDARNLDLARERIGMFLIEDETIGAAS